MEVREQYIILKSEKIVDSATSLKEAIDKFNALPPKKKILDGRAIYKLVKEDE